MYNVKLAVASAVALLGIVQFIGTTNAQDNQVIENAAGVGGWGGSCRCPDGSVYQVGDNGDECGSLACENGVAGTCNRQNGGPWSGRKVICAAWFISSTDTAFCEQGTEITTEDECRRAAQFLGNEFKNSESASDYPSGCYGHAGGKFYFNTHATGKAKETWKPICKAGNKIDMSCVHQDLDLGGDLSGLILSDDKRIEADENVINGILGVDYTGIENQIFLEKETSGKAWKSPKSCKRACMNADPRIASCAFFKWGKLHVLIASTKYYCLLLRSQVPLRKFEAVNFAGIITQGEIAVGPVFCDSEKLKAIQQSKKSSAWVKVVTCDAREARGSITCSFSKSVGISKSNSDSSSQSKSNSAHVDFSVKFGMEVGDPLGVAKQSLELSASTGFSWTSESSSSSTFTQDANQQTTSKADIVVEKGHAATICQPVGTIGDFIIKSITFKRVPGLRC